MRCLYCGTPLAVLRMLANGQFCSDEHRELHDQQSAVPPAAGRIRFDQRPSARRAVGNGEPFRAAPAPLDFLPRPEKPPSWQPAVAPGVHTDSVLAVAKVLSRPAPRAFSIGRRTCKPYDNPLPARLNPRSPRPTASGVRAVESAWPLRAARVDSNAAFTLHPDRTRRPVKAALTPIAPPGQPLFPRLSIPPSMARKSRKTDDRIGVPQRRAAGQIPIDLASQKLREIWRNMPGDLKIIALVIPMILLLTLNAAGPKLYTKPVAIKAAQEPVLDGMLMREWHAIRKSISLRAGIHYTDNFRSGLDAWTVGSDAKWSYDDMGFVRPGALALFTPTLPLSDYDVEFIARIEQKGLGFVFRAADTANYQAVRFLTSRSGPLAGIHIVRYAVINGREASKSDKPLPFALAPDTFFTVRLSVRGNDFTLMVQDRMADFWTDDRLKTGGIGFLCGKGESARLRRVEVTHQNDTLGRFCAYIASADLDSSNGS